MFRLMMIALLLIGGGCKQDPLKIKDKFQFPPPPNVPIPAVITPSVPGLVNLSNLEDTILLDLQALPSDNERLRSRYLVSCNQFNNNAEMKVTLGGVNKVINSLSNERQLVKVSPVGTANCVYRIDLDDYGLTSGEWALIDRYSLLQFDPQSIRAQNIQFLTQAQRPYLFADDFAVTTLEADALSDQGCNIYCLLIDQPRQLNQFFTSLGVDVQDEFDDESALYEATAESKIALGKTRGMWILETFDGWLLTSFDSALANQQSHFENPFVEEMTFPNGKVLSVRAFDDAAQEHIYTLPNGLFGFRLNASGGLGEAVASAPTDVVVNINDGSEGLDGTIRLGNCVDCHKNLVIPFNGQIKRHVEGSQLFDANEKELVRTYSNPTRIAATLGEIQTAYIDSLVRLDIDPSAEDPATASLIRPFRRRLDLNKVCSYTLLAVDECERRIRGASQSSVILGNVLNGGTVSLADFQGNFPTFVDELDLFDD